MKEEEKENEQATEKQVKVKKKETTKKGSHPAIIGVLLGILITILAAIILDKTNIVTFNIPKSENNSTEETTNNKDTPKENDNKTQECPETQCPECEKCAECQVCEKCAECPPQQTSSIPPLSSRSCTGKYRYTTSNMDNIITLNDDGTFTEHTNYGNMLVNEGQYIIQDRSLVTVSHIEIASPSTETLYESKTYIIASDCSYIKNRSTQAIYKRQ